MAVCSNKFFLLVGQDLWKNRGSGSSSSYELNIRGDVLEET